MTIFEHYWQLGPQNWWVFHVIVIMFSFLLIDFLSPMRAVGLNKCTSFLGKLLDILRLFDDIMLMFISLILWLLLCSFTDDVARILSIS